MKEILTKIYSNKEISIDDIAYLLKIFFKIKKQNVLDSAINNFIQYLIKYNEIPFFKDLHKFKSLNNIILEDLIPTIENYLEVTKAIDKENYLIDFNFNEEKLNKL
jgi:hypothetical protein